MLSFHWATLLPAISPQSRIILVRVRLVTTSSTFHLPPPILSPRYEKNQYHRRHESIKLQVSGNLQDFVQHLLGICGGRVQGQQRAYEPLLELTLIYKIPRK